MPININGTTDSRVGFSQLTIGDFTTDFDGTFVPVPDIAGSMNPTLGDFGIHLEGVFAETASFDGDINLTLGSFVPQLIGNQIQTVDGLMSMSLDGFSMSFQDSVAAEADWQARIGLPGTVWYHDFRTDAEVAQFRWTGATNEPGHIVDGNDPTGVGQIQADGDDKSLRRITADGITGGGCLEMVRSSDGDNAASFWRMFSPFAAPGNGRATDDPAALGTIPLQTWAPTEGGDETQLYTPNAPRPGFYGHPDYWPADPTSYDGHKFYLQMRVKMDPRRTDASNTYNGLPSNGAGGKLNYMTITDESNSSQEIVTYSGGYFGPQVAGNLNIYRAYRGGGVENMDNADSLGRPGQQVGSDLADYGGSGTWCNLGTQESFCWGYSFGWDTLMYAFTPGHHNVEDQRYEVWGANAGDTKYTKLNDVIFDAPFAADDRYGYSPMPQGWNAIILSTYQNNFALGQEFYHRFDQLIFSQDAIPCPRDTPTEWQVAADATALGDHVAVTKNTFQHPTDVEWGLTNVHYDVLRREIQYCGKPAASTNYSHYVFDEDTNAWTDIGVFHVSSGHIWGNCFDPDTGDLFVGVESHFLKHFKRSEGLSLGSWSSTADARDAGGPGIAVGAVLVGWHPNLYGPRAGGVCCFGTSYLYMYNPRTGLWNRGNTSAFSAPYSTRNNGTGLYLKGTDELIFFNSSQGGQSLVIGAGAGLSVDVIGDGLLTNRPAPPLGVIGSGGGTNKGYVALDPKDPNRIFLLESNRPSGSDRVWTSEDYGVSWGSPKAYTHPFGSMPAASAGEYFLGTSQPEESFIAVSSDSAGGATWLWKPDD